jgi:hypothetical protein
MSHPDAADRALAHCVLDAARDGEYVPDVLLCWALEITGDATPNMESRRSAVFVQTGPGTLQ